MENQVNLIINNICEKLGTTVEKMIPELALYKTRSAIALAIVGLIFFIALNCYGLLCYKYSKKLDNHYSSDAFAEIGMMLIIASTLIFTTIISISIYNYVIWSTAPTGATVQLILDQISN